MAFWWRRSLVAAAVLIGTVNVPAQDDARDRGRNDDQVGIFRTIVVDEEHGAGDVACVFCTVRVDGTVNGDVAVLFGTLDVAADREIRGDVATLFSTTVLADGARVNGDMMTALGTAQIAPTAEIHGDRAIFSSKLGLAVVLGPVLLGLGLIWLVVWVVRRVVLGR